MKKYIAVAVVFALAAFLSAGAALAQENAPGWEKGGAYDKLYNAKEMDRIKGKVEKIMEVTPMPGMAPGFALQVKDESKETVTVHLGPKPYADPKALGVGVGDKISVRGAWAQLDGKEVFIAAKLKKGEKDLKLRRTKDGVPLWTMTSEEQAKERSAD